MMFWAFLIGIYIYAMIMRKKHGPDMGYDRKNSACPPHRWASDPKTRVLTCELCKYVAGQDLKPRGHDDYR